MAGSLAERFDDDGGRQVTSLVTDLGVVVAVMSNIAYANTSSLAQRVGEAFGK